MYHLPIIGVNGAGCAAEVELQQHKGTCFSRRGAMPLESGRRSDSLGDIVYLQPVSLTLRDPEWLKKMLFCCLDCKVLFLRKSYFHDAKTQRQLSFPSASLHGFNFPFFASRGEPDIPDRIYQNLYQLL